MLCAAPAGFGQTTRPRALTGPTLSFEPTGKLPTPPETPLVLSPLEIRSSQPDPDQGLPYDNIGPFANASPINLLTALRLAEGNNLDIAQGREVVRQAQAGLTRARIQALPNLNLGSTYSHHEGNIAKTEGNIIKANKSSVFAGGGPSLTVALTDALIAPAIAKQVRSASRANLQRLSNETAFAVAEAYFAILRARRRLARVEEVLDHLTSSQPSPARADSKGLLPVVQGFLKVGGAEALKAEVDRVEVEVLRRQEERAAALQELRLASAELATLVRLDPLVTLLPVEDFRYPLLLPGDVAYEQPTEELVRLALVNRPELAENEALVRAAIERVRAAQIRPLLPNASLAYNFGGFGGGPDPNSAIVAGKVVTLPGFSGSGTIFHFNTRTDFDVSVFWRLQNMGLGDWAAVREQQALRRQAEWRKMQAQDRVILDVIQAQERVQGWRQRVATARTALFDAKGEPAGPTFRALRLNFERIRNVPGTRPLEVLDSIRGLSDLLETYGQTITEYERSRFRRLIAVGIPAREVIREFETLSATPQP